MVVMETTSERLHSKAKASSENEKKMNDVVAILKADLLKHLKENASLKDKVAKLERDMAVFKLFGLVMAFSVFPWTRVFLFMFWLSLGRVEVMIWSCRMMYFNDASIHIGTT